MATFEAFHVSDLHISAKPNVVNALSLWEMATRGVPAQGGDFVVRLANQTTYHAEIAKEAAKFIVDNRTDKSLLIISGDLACSGKRDDLLAALDFVEGQPNRSPGWYYQTQTGRPTLKNVSVPIVLVPGNHDRFRDWHCTPGGIEFDAVFSRHWSNPNPFVKSSVLLDPVGQKDSLGIVAADFCLEHRSDASSTFGTAGQGKVKQNVLDKIISETNRLKSAYKDVGIVWLLHFAPSPEICTSDELRLINCNLVMDAALQCGIELVLCGHVHKNLRGVRGSIEIVCAGTTMAMRPTDGNWIHHLTIEASGGVAKLSIRRDYRWSAQAQAFEFV